MANDARSTGRQGLIGLGGRVASVTLRPVTGAAAAAVEAGMGLERRAVDAVLDSAELERVLGNVLNSPRIQAAIKQLLESDGAKQLIDDFFDSGLFDRLADRLLESKTLWRLIDEIAASPAVTAAVTQQGLGFADQVGDQVRSRSRGADDWLERTARKLARRRATLPPGGEDLQPGVP